MPRTCREKNDGRSRSLRKRRYHFVQNPQQKIRVCCRSYSDPNFLLVLVEISCSPADGEQCNAKIKLEIHLWKGILLRASVVPCIPMSRYPSLSLSSEDLHDPIAPCADDPSPILAPDHGAHTLTPHQTMAGDLLGAASRFKTPEPEACVVPG
jgi:hypothetical protein